MPGREAGRALGTRPEATAMDGEHLPLLAWRRLRPESAAPVRVSVLRRRRKSAVYRLTGLQTATGSVIAKRCRRATASVEHTMYTRVLERLPVAAPRCHGLVEEPGSDFSWLFLEDVGETPFSPDSEPHRQLAARWLGLFHASAAAVAPSVELPDRSLEHHEALLASIIDTMGRHLDGTVELERLLRRCRTLAAEWQRVAAPCRGLPSTVVHGDFRPKNVHVRPTSDGLVLYPMDWEFAGRGTPAVDLGQVDVQAYRSVVSRFWDGLPLEDLRRASRAGMILRLLSAIGWEVASLEHAPDHKTVSRLAWYEAELSRAARLLS